MNQSGPFFHPRPPFDALALSLPQGNLHVDGHGLAGRRCDLHLRALRQDLQQRFFQIYRDGVKMWPVFGCISTDV